VARFFKISVSSLIRVHLPNTCYTNPLSGRVDYSIVNQFLSSAQLHSKVPQPTKQMVVVSQTGFDDSTRKTVFEIKAKFGIEIELKEPRDLLKL